MACSGPNKLRGVQKTIAPNEKKNASRYCNFHSCQKQTLP